MKERFYCTHQRENERGFILPLTIVISFLFLAFLLHEIKLYETQKKFMHGHEQVFMLQNLMQMASIDTIQVLNQHPGTKKGKFHYQNGTVQYQIKKLPKGTVIRKTLRQSVVNVQLIARTDTGGERVCHLYYDKKNKKMVRWVES